jgi:hypothetical protein
MCRRTHRAFVTKRKISGGTVSDKGRDARDVMLGLAKTCMKLKISFYHFLGSRLGIGPPIPPLATLVRPSGYYHFPGNMPRLRRNAHMPLTGQHAKNTQSPINSRFVPTRIACASTWRPPRSLLSDRLSSMRFLRGVRSAPVAPLSCATRQNPLDSKMAKEIRHAYSAPS